MLTEVKDVIDKLGIGEINDMLNPELRNKTLLSNVLEELNADQIEDEPTFSEWMKRNGRFFMWLFLSLPVLVTVYVIAVQFKFPNLIQYIIKNLASTDGKKLIMGELTIIILIVIIGVTLYLVFHESKAKIPDTNDFVKRAIDSERTILIYWMCVWATWFLFYSTLTLGFFKEADILKISLENYVFSALENLFNNASAIFFFCMYYEMSRKTKDNNDTKPLWLPFIFIIIGLFVIELIVLSQTQSNTVSQENQIIAVKNSHFYFSLFSGICNGITMGLFIARLESIIFNTPLFLVVFFTLYSVIQPTSYFLSNMEYQGLALVMILLAFYGKILLFITLMWLRDTNRLTYYLVRWLYIYQQEIDLKLRGLFFKALRDEESDLLNKNKTLSTIKSK